MSGDIRLGNSYYEDLHDSVGKFDFVMANPPFNVDKVDKEKIKDDPRFPFGMPRPDNANYLWIQLFYSSALTTRDDPASSWRILPPTLASRRWRFASNCSSRTPSM